MLQSLNKELLEIRLSGAIKNWTKTYIGLKGGTCEKQKLSIEADVLMLPIVLLVGPCILIVFAMLIYFVMTKRETEESKDVDFHDVEAILADSIPVSKMPETFIPTSFAVSSKMALTINPPH